MNEHLQCMSVMTFLTLHGACWDSQQPHLTLKGN